MLRAFLMVALLASTGCKGDGQPPGKTGAAAGTSDPAAQMSDRGHKECSTEGQDCKDPGKYCSSRGECVSHPLGDCPSDWRWRLPGELPGAKHPKVSIRSEEITRPSGLPSSCLENESVKPYLAWADHLGGAREVDGIHPSLAIGRRRQNEIKRCPSTFHHLQSWLSTGLGKDIATEPVKLALNIKTERSVGSQRRKFRLELGRLGDIHGFYAWPEGEGPFPAVLMLHGHYGRANRVFIDQGGRELVAAGFLVFAAETRALRAREAAGPCETMIAEHLWDKAGLPLAAALRDETFALLAALRALPEVDDEKIVIQAHSGSIQHALPAAIAWPHIRALAMNEDFASDVFWTSGLGVKRPHCTTIPGLADTVVETLKRPDALPFHLHRHEHRRKMEPDEVQALIDAFKDAVR